jgi:FkbM family methyltransferase
MRIIYREQLGIFWLRHALQRLVKLLRKKGTHTLKICAFPDDQIGRDIAVTGIYEAAGIKAIEWFISEGIIDSPEGRHFLDIGANVGVYSLSFAHIFKSVVAFEPHPITKKVLDLNVDINNIKNIIVSSYALSNRTGLSVLVDDLENAGAAKLSESNVNDGLSYDVEVKLASDAVIDILGDSPSIGLIKLDVEGHELKVIDGLKKILEASCPVLAFEANSPVVNKEVLPMLKQLGYKKFIALDFCSTTSSLYLRVLWLSVFGVKYGLKSVDSLDGRSYSLVFALNQVSTDKWNQVQKSL